MDGTAHNGLQHRGNSLRARLGARSVVIVGMPGSGKSSIGRRLAPRLGLDFVDADAKIEEAAGGMTIADIFAKHGEPEFRSLEARVIARLLDSGPSVIATGGGAFMNPTTRAAIREHAVSVWLQADIAVLLRRIKRKNDRPLLQNNDPETTLRRLLAERQETYGEADIAITSREGPHEAVVESVIEALENRLGAESADPRRREAHS